MDLHKPDTHGNVVSQNYRIITDRSFEARLKMFDPNLKLMFDHTTERWVVLEWALNGRGWNVVLKCEDSEGKPKPLGDWIFNTLWVYRHNHLEKKKMGATKWLDVLAAKAKADRQLEADKASEDSKAEIRENINQWRKAANELEGRPANDAVAGYSKRGG